MGLKTQNFKKFIDYFKNQEEKAKENKQIIKELKEEGKISEAKTVTKIKNIWIIKPGENSNRGTGIIVKFFLKSL